MANGGARKGSGRKPMAIEDDVKGAIKAALNSSPGAMEEVWKKIVEKAKAGSEKHAMILLNYYYGKPKENEGNASEMIITVVRK